MKRIRSEKSVSEPIKRMIYSTIMIVLVVLVIIMDKVPFFGVLSLFWKNNRVFPYSCFIAA